jgi:hypothetical protein
VSSAGRLGALTFYPLATSTSRSAGCTPYVRSVGRGRQRNFGGLRFGMEICASELPEHLRRGSLCEVEEHGRRVIAFGEPRGGIKRDVARSARRRPRRRSRADRRGVQRSLLTSLNPMHVEEIRDQPIGAVEACQNPRHQNTLGTGEPGRLREHLGAQPGIRERPPQVVR